MLPGCFADTSASWHSSVRCVPARQHVQGRQHLHSGDVILTCVRVCVDLCGSICFSHTTDTVKQRSEYLWPDKARCPLCGVLFSVVVVVAYCMHVGVVAYCMHVGGGRFPELTGCSTLCDL